MGKSRLVSEFIGSLDDRANVVRGRCLSYGEGITYWPVAEIVRAATGIGQTPGGDPAADIARIAGVCPNTMRAYLREYRDGGIARVKEVRFYRPQSELVAHQSSFEDHFRKHPPATVKELVPPVKAKTHWH